MDLDASTAPPATGETTLIERRPPFDWGAPRLVPLYAAIHLSVQGLLSTLVYNVTLRRSADAAAPAKLYTTWELRVPLFAPAIVPYLSIYALFVASFFLCRTARDLMTLSLRLTMGVAISGACFLLWPTQSGFVRPKLDGVLGWLLDVLDRADAPYNMAPSLHVTTTVILIATLWRRTGGWTRMALGAWGVLIVLSTLLTWQHHLFDVLSGLVLGAFCVRAFPTRKA